MDEKAGTITSVIGVILTLQVFLGKYVLNLEESIDALFFIEAYALKIQYATFISTIFFVVSIAFGILSLIPYHWHEINPQTLLDKYGNSNKKKIRRVVSANLALYVEETNEIIKTKARYIRWQLIFFTLGIVGIFWIIFCILFV